MSLARLLPLALVLALSGVAAAAPPAPSKATEPADAKGTRLRARVGMEQVARLLRSTDPDERIRGIARAASIGSREAVALLVEESETDSRALVAMTRALAKFADQDIVRTRLLAIVTGSAGSSRPKPATPGRAAEDADALQRVELARETAALALARSGGERALESLYGYARGTGAGQHAALHALTVFPPREAGFFGTPGGPLPIGAVRLLAELGDLRALDVLHATARSNDIAVRAAALLALGRLGDARALPLARTAIAERDARLREAAAEVFVVLAAPERIKTTIALINDEPTTTIGLRLAERVHDPAITKLVAARAAVHPVREIRERAIATLGRTPDPEAAKALLASQIVADPELAWRAYHALARSPAPNAATLVGGALRGPNATLAVRAYLVRALLRGERTSALDEAVFASAKSASPALRALGVFGRVALGDRAAADFLDSPDIVVRRAAASAAPVGPHRKDDLRALLARLTKEPDSATRELLAVGLIDGDPDGIVKTSTLVERAESAGGDAPLAAFALAARADEPLARKVGELLASRDAKIRAHVARGLAASPLPDAVGRLAELYADETDAVVRRAIVTSLAARTADANAPARREALELAASVDPDGPTRQAARRALDRLAPTTGTASVQELAWLRLTRSDASVAPSDPFTGSLVRSDGIAVPVLFDDEGQALVPALPPGEVRLALAPSLPTYKENPK